MSKQEISDIAASFQAAVIDVLVAKTKRAADKIKAKTALLGGGVAANSSLRAGLTEMCEKAGLQLLIAPRPLCTDNAVMVAALAYHKFVAGKFAELSLEPKASF
jgi:N6-L-threonylcarbamoyladenine synthase